MPLMTEEEAFERAMNREGVAEIIKEGEYASLFIEVFSKIWGRDVSLEEGYEAYGRYCKSKEPE